jgi:hypothetical protein
MAKVARVIPVFIFLSQLGWGQVQGTIKGVVVDEQSKPVVKADVHIAENKTFVGHRLVDMHETDDQGRFVINKVPWGTYVVMAGKEGAGYPDSRLAFYSNLAVPTVTLAPAFPVATVSVPIGPKAGILELAPVRDSKSGKKIDAATVTLRRVQNPDFFITTFASGSQVLVPSQVEVSIEIAAPNYKSWPSLAGTHTEGQIRLRPGELFKLTVALQCDTGSGKVACDEASPEHP